MKAYDWITVGVTAVYLVVTAIACRLAGCEKADKADETLNKYIKVKNKHIKVSILWLCAYYWLTAISILSTIIVIYITTFPEDQETYKVFVYSVFSLFCTVINFVLNPREISAAYRKCFILLNRAVSVTSDTESTILPYQKRKNKHSILTETNYKCEQILNHVYYK